MNEKFKKEKQKKKIFFYTIIFWWHFINFFLCKTFHFFYPSDFLLFILKNI